CKPIGVLYMIDGGEKDEKILAVPKKDPFFNKVNDISELPSHYIDEIKHFFAAYKALENKETKVKNVEGADTAKNVIKKALENYKKKFGCNN
ncbi:MAG: inorganic diphosphatase, partial [Oscillospiraceae bacterium]